MASSVWRVRKMCERPGCSAPAEVSYGIDNVSLIVWMDDRAPTAREMPGRLCRRHADALVVPRGWSLDDRRQPVPRLFAAVHLADVPASQGRHPDGPPSKSMRRPKTDDGDPRLSLFDMGHDNGTGTTGEEGVLAEENVSAQENSTSTSPELEDVPVTHDDQADHDQADHDQLDPDQVDPDQDETKAMPWSPRLTAGGPVSLADDDGNEPVLGRLLGRAFGRPRADGQ